MLCMIVTALFLVIAIDTAKRARGGEPSAFWRIATVVLFTAACVEGARILVSSSLGI